VGGGNLRICIGGGPLDQFWMDAADSHFGVDKSNVIIEIHAQQNCFLLVMPV